MAGSRPKRLLSLLVCAALIAGLVPTPPASANTMIPQSPIATGKGPKFVTVGDVDNDGDQDVVVANYVADSKTHTAGGVSVYLQNDTTHQLDPKIDVYLPYPGTATSVRVADVTGDGQNDLLVSDSFMQRIYIYQYDGMYSPPFNRVGYLTTWSEGAGPYSSPMDFDLGDLSMDGEPDLLVPMYYTSVEDNKGGYGLYSSLASNPYRNLRGLQVMPDGTILAGNSAGNFAMSRDGGKHWMEIAGVDASNAITDLTIMSGSTLLATTARGWIITSADYGQTWTLVDDTRLALTSIAGAPENPYAFLTAPKGQWGYFSGMKSNMTRSQNTSDNLSDVAVYPEDGTAIAVGANGTALLMDQLGQIETSAPAEPSRANLRAVTVSGPGATVAGDGGIYRFDRSTRSWTTLLTAPEVFTGVEFASDAVHGVAVGLAGAVYRTDDGGSSWTQVAVPGLTEDLRSVTADSSRTGWFWAIGDAGTIIHSEDNGATWTTVDPSAWIRGWSGLRYTPDSFTIHPFSGRIADVSGDGIPDLSLAHYDDGSFITAWLSGSNLLNIKLDTEPLAAELRSVAIGDLNDDGLNDVAGVAYGSGEVSVAYQNSIGWPLSGDPSQVYLSGTSAGSAPVNVTIADVSKDGLNDVIVANSRNDGLIDNYEVTGTVSVFMQNRKTHKLDAVGEYYVGRQPAGVAVGDINSDGENEIIVTNNVDNSLQVLQYGPPLPPYISSTSYPEQDTYYAATLGQFKLTSPADFDGIAGFRYVIDRDPSTVPTAGAQFSADGVIDIRMDTYASQLGTATSGEWYIHAVSLDRSGNLGTQAAHYPFHIDTAPPADITLDDGQSGWTKSAVRHFTWTPSSDDLSGLARYWVRVNGGTETSLTASVNSLDFTNLPDGPTVVEVRAEDVAGNFSAWASHTAYIDAGSPDVTITAPAVDDEHTNGVYKFTADALDTAGVSAVGFYIDGTPMTTDTVAPYEFSKDVSELTTGTHTLSVRAVDRGDNATVRSRTFNTGMLAPVITSATHPDEMSYYNSGTGMFSIAATPAAEFAEGFRYTIDKDPNGQPTDASAYTFDGSVVFSIHDYATLKGLSDDGSWYIHAASLDSQNHLGPVATYRFNVDHTAPTAPSSFDDGVSGWTSSAIRHFAWTPSSDTPSGVQRYWIRIANAGTFTDRQVSSVVTSTDLMDLPEGETAVSIRSEDMAGNLSGWTSHSVYVDYSGPEVSVDLPAVDGDRCIGTYPFMASVQDAGGVAAVGFYIDGNVVGTDTVAPYGINYDTMALANGTHTLTVKAVDGAGNEGAATRTFVTGKLAPVIVSFTHADSSRYYSDRVATFTISATPTADFGQGFRYSFDKNPAGAPTNLSPYTSDGNVKLDIVDYAALNSLTADGTWYLHAATIDSQGRLGAVGTYAFKVDRTSPTAADSLDDGVSGWTSTAIRHFTWAPAGDALSGIESYWVSLTNEHGASQFMVVPSVVTNADLMNLPEGESTLTVRAVDAAGNIGPAISHALGVDAEPPTAQVTSPTAEGERLPRTYTFRADAQDGAGIQAVGFYVDGSLVGTDTSQPYSATADLGPLTTGSHTLEVRAVDRIGNVTSATRGFAVDPDAPTILSYSHPTQTAFYNSLVGDFLLLAPSSDGSEGFVYTIDQDPATVPTLASSFSADGNIRVGMEDYAAFKSLPLNTTWYIHARTWDADGHLGSDTATYAFKVDLELPSAPTNFDDGVSGWTSHGIRHFTWTASSDAVSGIARYWVRVNEGAETSVAAGVRAIDFTDLPQGQARVSIRAEDKAGNFSDWVTHVAWINSTPPTVAVTAPMTDGDAVAGSYTFQATAADTVGLAGVGFYIDGTLIGTDTVAPYSWTYATSSLGVGSHTLTARAANLGGVTTDALRTFVVGEAPPVVISSSHPTQTDYYNSVYANFVMASAETTDQSDGFCYVIDRNPTTLPTQASSFNATGILRVNMDDFAALHGTTSEGTWYLHVAALDSNGHLSPVTHYQFMTDLTVPTTPASLDDGVEGWTAYAIRRFDWAASSDSLSGVARYWYRVNAGVETSVAAGVTGVDLTDLADGANTFQVRAQDAAGNYSSWVSHTAYVDANAPKVSVAAPDSGDVVGAHYTFKASAVDSASVEAVGFYLDGSAIGTDTAAPYELAYDLTSVTAGSHKLRVKAVDRCGNSATASHDFTLDNVAPSITKVSDTPDPFFPILRDGYKDNLTVHFTLSEASSVTMKAYNSSGTVIRTISAKKAAGSNSLVWNGRNSSNKAVRAGTYYYRLYATDAAGNTRTGYKYSATVKSYIIVKVGSNGAKVVYH